MSGRKERTNDFIVQAGILAAAGIISRIIGLLYRSPLYNVVGALGMGYYNSAYNYYTIILMSLNSMMKQIERDMLQKFILMLYSGNHFREMMNVLSMQLSITDIALFFLVLTEKSCVMAIPQCLAYSTIICLISLILPVI